VRIVNGRSRPILPGLLLEAPDRGRLLFTRWGERYIANMRKRLFYLLTLIGMLLACGTARAEDLALVGAKIYPSPSEAAIENGAIVVHDGHIVAVGPSAAVTVPRGAKVINCKGLVVTAGFWNSHVHMLCRACCTRRNSRRNSSVHSLKRC
jgi:hypothetical protein